MSTDEKYFEDEERVDEVKSQLASALNYLPGVNADGLLYDTDVYVSGPLSVIMEFCQENRSEIEELG